MPVRPMYPGEGSGNGTGAVNSVNGEKGDVVITAQDLNAQPASTVLTDIAAITMPENSFLHTDGSGNFTPSLCMPAGLAWLSYTTVDQQKDHLALAEVASSGDYSDLTNKPTTFTPAVHTHTISDVTGLQSSLDSKLGVGASIPYSSLTGAPIIPAAQVNSDWTATSGVSQVLNKPTLATVATTGSYDDLTNKPVIPSVNYPVTSVNTKVGAVVLTNTDVGAAASVHAHVISDITNLQSTLDSKASITSLSGYATTASLSGYATTSDFTTGLAGKFNTPTGTTSQYIRGDGSLATLPSSTRTFTNPARTLNTAFQISTTQDAQVHYAVDITVGALVLGGQSGRVILEYADNIGMTTNVITVNTGGNSTSGVLNITNLGTVSLSGMIPSGKYVRLRTVNVTGTPTYTFQNAQEILL